MTYLNVEYHEKALLANQKRFYKRSVRVGSARKPIDKSKETCFAMGKLVIFKKTVPQTKPLLHPIHPQTTPSTNPNHTHHPSTKHPPKTLDEEFVSLEDEGTTKIRAFMAIAEDEPSVRKANARSDYTHVDLTYVEDQRKNLLNKFNLLKQELSLHKSELCNLKILKVTLDQLLFEQIPGNIIKALGGRGKRKEKISSKEVIFTKADESSSTSIPEITSDFESECETQKPLPPLPKLIGATPAGTSDSLISLFDITLNMTDLTLDTSVPKKTRPTSIKVSPRYVIKRKTENKSLVVSESYIDKKADSSIEQLLLTLMEEVKGLKRQIETPLGTSPSNSQSSLKSNKQKTWFGPCKHCGFRNHLSNDYYSKPKCSTYGSTDHWTKEHLEPAVKKTLIKLKAQSPLNPILKKALMIPKPFKESGNLGLLISNPRNPLKSGFTKGTNLCENVCVGLPKEETQKDMAQLIVMESPLPGLLIKDEVSLSQAAVHADYSQAKERTLENLLIWARNRKNDSLTFKCRVTIDGIRSRKGWNFPGCGGEKCKKGVVGKDGSFWCQACEKAVDYLVLRYRLELDTTTSASKLTM
ncbi:retrovirus-related pol polyprotein from transposon TNT 1-94 [Tanacetum coccineum]|uniref:Retrovirus-related pol polyprotein from transposon TNT 1-94 n=1 Tax=Tanacetum coccineum TaxID=301880 RepID=A0ABQ4WK59_9ASTR